MHIPDGWVDLPTSATAGVIAAGGVGAAARSAAGSLRDKVTTLPAVVAAYLLVAQLLVLPVGFGTSAHLIGTGLAALLVGPAIAIVCVAVVVVVQAVVLADGGVTAIGLNVIDDGLVPALVTWALFVAVRPCVRRASALADQRRRAAIAAGAAAAVGSMGAAMAAAGAFALGGTDAVPTRIVAATMGGAHLAIAAIEGVLTGLILTTVLRLRPDLVRALPARADATTPAPPAPTATLAADPTYPVYPAASDAEAVDAVDLRRTQPGTGATDGPADGEGPAASASDTVDRRRTEPAASAKDHGSGADAFDLRWTEPEGEGTDAEASQPGGTAR
jgi:cobalt/nickel transport system permease protein